MTSRERRHMEFMRKPLIVEDGTDMCESVKEIEKIISQPITIWDDEEIGEKYRKINSLPLEEKRLLIVYSILEGSVNKVARTYGVDRKTIVTRINGILEKLGVCKK